MVDQLTVPEEYVVLFRRVLPYLAAPLQKNIQVLKSLVLYLKLGGEKMARVAIEAMNVTQRLQDAELKKLLLEQELLNGERLDEMDEEEEEEEDGDDDNDNQSDSDADLDEKDDFADDDSD